MRFRLGFAFLFPLLLLSSAPLLDAGPANTTAKLPPELIGVSFDQKLESPVPLGTAFHDSSGNPVLLRQFFHGKPVVLATVYYTCPMLCSQILSGIVRGLRPLSLQPGRDFEIIAISINPAETPQQARVKEEQYSLSYSRKAGPAGWHFLVGSEPAIRAVTDAIGLAIINFTHQAQPASMGLWQPNQTHFKRRFSTLPMPITA